MENWKKWTLVGLGAAWWAQRHREQPLGNPQMACPRPTQDLKLNTRNRNKAIKAPYIQYGPLNLADNKYWQRIARHWNTSLKVAKKSLCGNCVAFDVSPRMEDCMPGPVSDQDGRLGYCHMHHFKCHSARTCYTWAAGGPIKKNKISYEWQHKD
tara:strand:- start:4 stop:465 length:462 start_codon:yes stop_codon:yes gene_type:complete